MITLSARCTGNAQDTAGKHVATLVAENGFTTFSLPSEDLAFVPGNTYKVSIDGEFVKAPAKPVAFTPAPKPIAPIAPKPAEVAHPTPSE